MQGGETLTPADSALERVMLGIRLADGLAMAEIDPTRRPAADALAAAGLLDAGAWRAGRAVLTMRGRLLAELAGSALTRVVRTPLRLARRGLGAGRTEEPTSTAGGGAGQPVGTSAR